MWKEFKEFALKGNVLDMAVGVVIGSAFSAIVTSLVNDLFMPLISLLTGNLDFNNLFLAMDGNTYETIAAAKEAGVATFNYGTFLSAVLNFILVAVGLFFFVKGVNKLRRMRTKEEPPAPAPAPKRVCPYCFSEIADEATRCPHCTSVLELAQEQE